MKKKLFTVFNSLDIDVLQSRLKSLEKKGQQILVIKKLLKKKEDKLRNEKHAASSDGTISSRRKFIATWSSEAFNFH